jgi:hypothetical protein
MGSVSDFTVDDVHRVRHRGGSFASSSEPGSPSRSTVEEVPRERLKLLCFVSDAFGVGAVKGGASFASGSGAGGRAAAQAGA